MAHKKILQDIVYSQGGVIDFKHLSLICGLYVHLNGFYTVKWP